MGPRTLQGHRGGTGIAPGRTGARGGYRRPETARADVETSGGARADTGNVPEGSPQTRGALARNYEARNGTMSLLEQDLSSQPPPTQQRAMRKPATTTFSDATNPFSRTLSKHIVHIEDARDDRERAGARTRNPCVIPCQQLGSEQRSRSEDGRRALVPYQYSTGNDWRPAKRSPRRPLASSRCGEGVQANFSPPEPLQRRGQQRGVLENYLNDMKRCRASLRTVHSGPSADLQRMNDERVKLPAERQAAKMRRSHSAEPRATVSVQKEDNYGFRSRKPVAGNWAHDIGGTMIHHTEPEAATPRSSIAASMESLPCAASAGGTPPCTPRQQAAGCKQRQASADSRFEEMVLHMKAANPEQRLRFELFKARGESSLGIRPAEASEGSSFNGTSDR